ncbi:Guanine nucleotide-binding protein, beta subunit [Trema orientale]|uniref:Guanine nucleotide-binding protein, beta subunit n=1 Tax=Trema orientale TaxID=63057 RepID=A0A2P5F8V6_TREOI|nr:Guanine nucleotide-binding protein, beta subunit [Trema orientale]
MEVLLASSSVDGGISCWDLNTGAERLHYKSCASPVHGLVCVGQRFIASSQLRDAKASSGSVFYWSWHKPQVEVKSFPAEQINPLAANSEGTYIVGGGLSGGIYLWEVASGRLLRKWDGHHTRVSCLVFSDDDSLLISGGGDGSVRVWSLLKIFDDYLTQQASHLYEYNFMEHQRCVNGIKAGYGGHNAIIVSASSDKTCKVWSLSGGKLLRDIVFPSEIEAIAMDPVEAVFYAGGHDGKIYVAALHTDSPNSKNHGLHILRSFEDLSKVKVNCLEYNVSRNVLISGSEDGWVRVWDVGPGNVIGKFRHGKDAVNNIVVVRQQLYPSSQNSSRRRGSLLPPLEKYAISTDEDTDTKTVLGFQETNSKSMDATYHISNVINYQIKELQQRGSAASEMEMDRLKLEYKKSLQMVHQWKRMYENLHQFCVNELLEDGAEAGGPNRNST